MYMYVEELTVFEQHNNLFFTFNLFHYQMPFVLLTGGTYKIFSKAAGMCKCREVRQSQEKNEKNYWRGKLQVSGL